MSITLADVKTQNDKPKVKKLTLGEGALCFESVYFTCILDFLGRSSLSLLPVSHAYNKVADTYILSQVTQYAPLVKNYWQGLGYMEKLAFYSPINAQRFYAPSSKANQTAGHNLYPYHFWVNASKQAQSLPLKQQAEITEKVLFQAGTGDWKPLSIFVRPWFNQSAPETPEGIKEENDRLPPYKIALAIGLTMEELEKQRISQVQQPTDERDLKQRSEDFIRLNKKHLQAVFFYSIDFAQIYDLKVYQIDAIIKGYTPTSVRGLSKHQVTIMMRHKLNRIDVESLNDKQLEVMIEKKLRKEHVQNLNETQLEGLRLNLSREQVNNDWIRDFHIEAIRDGLAYDLIFILHKFQIDGIRFNLSREQVTAPWFNVDHLIAIREGFHYEWIKGMSTTHEANVRAIIRLESYRGPNVPHLPHYPEWKLCDNKMDYARFLPQPIKYEHSQHQPNLNDPIACPFFNELESLTKTKVDQWGTTRQSVANFIQFEKFVIVKASELDLFKKRWKNKLPLLQALRKTIETGNLVTSETPKDYKANMDKPVVVMTQSLSANGSEQNATVQTFSANGSAAAGHSANTYCITIVAEGSEPKVLASSEPMQSTESSYKL